MGAITLPHPEELHIPHTVAKWFLIELGIYSESATVVGVAELVDWISDSMSPDRYPRHNINATELEEFRHRFTPFL